jgi:hypothetical protein
LISIITSSRDQQQFEAYCENIESTIGLPFEILHERNANGAKGLCRLYNELAEQAKYPYLIFLHEDVAFRQSDWGKVLVELLEDTSVGLVGVLGSDTLTSVPSGWAKQNGRFNLGFLLQSDAESQVADAPCKGSRQVFCVDGVLMATKKAIWQECRFDEQLLQGFHGYDYDFSLQIAERYKVFVTCDIRLEHFSKGNFNAQWVEATMDLNKKWSTQLHRTLRTDMTQSDWTDLEYWQAVTMIGILKEQQLSAKYGWYTIRKFTSIASRKFRLIVRLIALLFQKS